jgi:hypothetical protein
MLRRIAFVIAPALALVLVMAAASRAADDTLKIIPGKALGWGVINHLADGDAKIQKLAAVVGAPQVGVLDLVKNQLGVKEGLRPNGALGVIAMPPKDKEDADAPPTPVFFVAVSDYNAFLGNFEPEKKQKISSVQIAGKPAAMAHLGGYALVTKREDQDALEGVLAAKKSIADEAKSLETWLAANDANIVLTKAGVKRFAAQGQAGLKKLGETLGALGDQGAPAKAAFELYASMLDSAEKGVSLAAMGLQVDKAGNVRLAARAKIVARGEFATALAGVKPAEGNLLAGLPGGAFIFAGGGVMHEDLYRPLMNMSVSMMKKMPEVYGLDAEQAEKMSKISTQGFKSLHSMSMVMKTGNRGEPLYSNIYATFGVDDADKFLADYEKQIDAMKDLLKDVKEGLLKPPVAKKIEIDGKPGLEVVITIPVPKMPGNPMAEKMMQGMFGPDNKSTMYITKGDEKTVYLSFGVTQDKLPRAIAVGKDEKKTLAANADVASTLALLPPGSQGILLISPRGYMGMVSRMMESMMGENQPAIKIPQFPKCPPIGIAIQAAPGEFSGTMVVPAEMIKASSEYAATIRQGALNPAQPGVP